MTAHADFISVVIPTRDRREVLRKCLSAFAGQTYPADCREVIVVDDGSTDGTAGFLEETSRTMPNLRHFSQAAHSPAKARNLGIANARGPLVLLTGDDCIPHPRLLEAHQASHRKEKNVAVLGHIEWHPDLEVTPFMQFVGRTHQFTYPHIARHALNVPPWFFYTSNISAEKDLLTRAALFDEDFTDAAYEDAELGYRLSRAGVRIIYNRKALTYHDHPVTLEQYIRRQIRAGKAAVTFFRKHPEAADTLRMEDAASAELREQFYDAVLRYYYAVGLQAGIAAMNGAQFEEAGFMVPLDDILRSWNAKVTDRLLLRISRENARLKTLEGENARLSGELGNEQARAVSAENRNSAIERTLAEYRAFAEKVKATLPYRIYHAIKALCGRGDS